MRVLMVMCVNTISFSLYLRPFLPSFFPPLTPDTRVCTASRRVVDLLKNHPSPFLATSQLNYSEYTFSFTLINSTFVSREVLVERRCVRRRAGRGRQLSPPPFFLRIVQKFLWSTRRDIHSILRVFLFVFKTGIEIAVILQSSRQIFPCNRKRSPCRFFREQLWKLRRSRSRRFLSSRLQEKTMMIARDLFSLSLSLSLTLSVFQTVSNWQRSRSMDDAWSESIGTGWDAVLHREKLRDRMKKDARCPFFF